MDFTKVQSVGNDFVLLETNDNTGDWANIAQTICNRHFGIGADGLLLLMKSNTADFRMRIFNADGSEAEACGNGLRCIVHYIKSKGLSGSKNLSIETAGGIRNAGIVNTTGGNYIRIGMGSPVFELNSIPVVADIGRAGLVCGMTVNYPLAVDSLTIKLNFISMGNPHAVYFTDKPVQDFPLAVIGPQVEIATIFPRKTNFEVARVINSSSIEMRVWERGVGETLACGSGACAVAVAGWVMGCTGDRVDITLPGGELMAEWSGQGEVYLTGQAETVFSGCWIK
jgi:diaminopimelate epimerase